MTPQKRTVLLITHGIAFGMVIFPPWIFLLIGPDTAPLYSSSIDFGRLSLQLIALAITCCTTLLLMQGKPEHPLLKKARHLTLDLLDPHGIKPVIRDLAIVWGLTFSGRFFLSLTGPPDPSEMMVANSVLTVVGFTLSACLIEVDRGRHVARVAVALAITNVINVLILGASLSSWFLGFPLIAIWAAIGCALSFAFIPQMRKARPSTPPSISAPPPSAPS